MMIRSVSMLAAAALAAASVPGLAQGVYDPGLPPPLPNLDDTAAGTWEGEWDGEWEAPDRWYGLWRGTYTGLYGEVINAEYRGTFLSDTQFRSEDGHHLYHDEDRGWYEGHAPSLAHDAARHPALHDRPVGYSPAQRAGWLDQCRATFYSDDGRRRGAALGGVLGAAAGGIAGNRLARDSRLGGTLLGAGIGGIAGAAIGGAIGTEEDGERFDECELYLLRYEQSFPGHAGDYGYGPVMWVKVPIVRTGRRDCRCERVMEERVVEEETIITQPAPTKRVRVAQPAPTKTIRSTK